MTEGPSYQEAVAAVLGRVLGVLEGALLGAIGLGRLERLGSFSPLLG